MDEPALVLLESVEVEDEEDDSLNEKIYKKFVELRVASHLDRKAEANQNSGWQSTEWKRSRNRKLSITNVSSDWLLPFCFFAKV